MLEQTLTNDERSALETAQRRLLALRRACQDGMRKESSDKVAQSEVLGAGGSVSLVEVGW
jgi:hypothetical protein